LRLWSTSAMSETIGAPSPAISTARAIIGPSREGASRFGPSSSALPRNGPIPLAFSCPGAEAYPSPYGAVSCSSTQSSSVSARARKVSARSSSRAANSSSTLASPSRRAGPIESECVTMPTLHHRPLTFPAEPTKPLVTAVQIRDEVPAQPATLRTDLWHVLRSAVDRKDHTGDEPGLIAEQPGRGRRDLLGLAQTLGRNLGRVLRALLLRQARQGVGLDRTGATALMRIPRGAYSTAALVVREATPCLLAP